MSPAAWLFLGTSATALVTLGGAWITLAAARATARSTERTEAAKTSVDKSKADIDNLRSIIEAQNDYIARVHEREDEERRHREDCEQRCTECLERVKALEVARGT